MLINYGLTDAGEGRGLTDSWLPQLNFYLNSVPSDQKRPTVERAEQEETWSRPRLTRLTQTLLCLINEPVSANAACLT